MRADRREGADEGGWGHPLRDDPPPCAAAASANPRRPDRDCPPHRSARAALGQIAKGGTMPKSTVALTLVSALIVSATALGQASTPAPDVVPGAARQVERIKIHGTALEGNLEGNTVDRDVIVFLPPSYCRSGIAGIRSSTPCTAIRLAPSSGRRRSTCRRRSRAPSPRARKR